MAKKYLCVNLETGRQFTVTEAGLAHLNKHVKHAKTFEVIEEITTDENTQTALTGSDTPGAKNNDITVLKGTHGRIVNKDQGGIGADAGTTDGGTGAREGGDPAGDQQEINGGDLSESEGSDLGDDRGESDEQQPETESDADEPPAKPEPEKPAGKGGKKGGKSGVFKD